MGTAKVMWMCHISWYSIGVEKGQRASLFSESFFQSYHFIHQFSKWYFEVYLPLFLIMTSLSTGTLLNDNYAVTMMVQELVMQEASGWEKYQIRIESLSRSSTSSQKKERKINNWAIFKAFWWRLTAMSMLWKKKSLLQMFFNRYKTLTYLRLYSPDWVIRVPLNLWPTIP